MDTLAAIWSSKIYLFLAKYMEKSVILIGTQLLKKFFKFYGIQGFIVVLK